LAEFQRVVEQRPVLQASVAQRGVALLQAADDGAAGPASNQLEAIGWIRRWGVLGSWLALFVGVNLWLFVGRLRQPTGRWGRRCGSRSRAAAGRA
jgi:hypothetical protein